MSNQNLRFPRSMREGFGHYTGTRFDPEPPRFKLGYMITIALAVILVVCNV